MASSPQCPWHNIKQELQDILVKLEKETKPFSLEFECPHIVGIQNVLQTTLWEVPTIDAHVVCFIVGYDFNSLCVGKYFYQIDTFLEISKSTCYILWFILFMD
jgi:hypothetical protein